MTRGVASWPILVLLAVACLLGGCKSSCDSIEVDRLHHTCFAEERVGLGPCDSDCNAAKTHVVEFGMARPLADALKAVHQLSDEERRVCDVTLRGPRGRTYPLERLVRADASAKPRRFTMVSARRCSPSPPDPESSSDGEVEQTSEDPAVEEEQ